MDHVWQKAAGLWLAVCLVPAGAVLGAVPTSQPGRLSDDQLADLVGQLNDKSYPVREQASSKLAGLPFEQLGRLAPLFKSSDAPEQRLRLRNVARQIYIEAKKADAPGEGFLGVTHVQTTVVTADPAEPTVRVLVNSVLSDSPAERVGLQGGDQIVALDGKPILETDGGFADQIRAKRPGAKAKLTVLRGGKKMQMAAVLANRRDFDLDGDDPQWVRQFNEYWRQKFDPNDTTGDDGGQIRALGNGVIIIQGGGQVIFEP